ncbi:serine acetyltransferase [Mucilaginibacter sp. X5P1]|uniref:serine acetyltransferase n=1 Tax=Mucilaginibacter sp. X5P1 TaxID=2723088 RepID=UPI00161C221D|nr:serine acetyltransferase [Mucilaginibacter sp. X5P1]
MKRNFSILQDWSANKGNPKGRTILLLYRLAIRIRFTPILLLFFFWYLILYIFFVEWLLGVELTFGAVLGSGTQIWHGYAIVLNPAVRIGNDCVLRHSLTIGNKGADSKCPVIGNNVNIGAGVCILGDLNIGDNVVIGAGSIVVKDIPSNSVAVGNPARIINKS